VVAREGEAVAFVEVKSRSVRPAPAREGHDPGPSPDPDPLEAVNRRKRRELRRTAAAWIRAHPGVGREFRFDAVAVRFGAGGPRPELVRDAFR